MTVTHTETSALREHPDFLAPNFFFSASIKGLAAPLFVRKHVRFGNEIREKKIEGKEVIRSDEKRVGGEQRRRTIPVERTWGREEMPHKEVPFPPLPRRPASDVQAPSFKSLKSPHRSLVFQLHPPRI